MKVSELFLLVVLGAVSPFLLAGCTHRPPVPKPPGALGGLAAASSAPAPGAGPSDGLPADCNPLRSSGVCLLPWPSAVYLRPDASAQTGYRLALAARVLPNVAGTRQDLDPSRFNMADGFSPATPLLVSFPEKIDPTSLVPPSDPSKSLGPAGATVLLDMESHTLVLHISEVDATVTKEGRRQAVIIRPLSRLLPGHRYAAAVTRSIKTTGGGLPTAPSGFASIADGAAPPDALAQKQSLRMPEILSALERGGIHRRDLLVAWDFVTASNDFLVGRMRRMRDTALKGPVGSYTLTEVQEKPGPGILRIIRGTFKAPRFLTQSDRTKLPATLDFDGSGHPIVHGEVDVPFTGVVPAVATTRRPLPVVLFGHGQFGGREAIASPNAGTPRELAAEQGYVMFATDWLGLTRADLPLPAGNGLAAEAFLDLNHLPWMTDRLQQALVNALVFTRVLREKIVIDAALTVTGKGGPPIADPSRLYYYGNSLGGHMGATLLAYAPALSRAVLNVAGANWSAMFQRSSQWPVVQTFFGKSYPDPIDQQLLLALAQTQFDFVDPIHTALHGVDPSPARADQRVLLRMAVGDSQVPNLATEMLARTAGIPLLAPSPSLIYGLLPQQGPLPSALSIWDLRVEPGPPTNASPPRDNGAHVGIHRLPHFKKQVEQFFRTGEVISPCDGPCDPE